MSTNLKLLVKFIIVKCKILNESSFVNKMYTIKYKISSEILRLIKHKELH